ncbi:VOC family protein [Kitasatospora purpeofusca]|uniref:VOC family protein n=1 Tax=Kitasatospora purpeofusca TaxID=67352 RepID=UPI002A59EE1E|nr:VOC family protein [Kitasatospora purpeofusca]MDY0810628.1 VOC family protein [Kitasatospora purpeofusca]
MTGTTGTAGADALESAVNPCCVPAAPCWVGLLSRDLVAAKAFYGPLLGWTFREVPSVVGVHLHGLVDGTVVAGLSEAARRWEFPVAWTTYFGAEDADATAERVRSGGGTVAVGPLAFDGGRLVLAADGRQAVFGIWQAPAGPPRLLDGPGAPVWTELHTTDPFAAALFHGRVFAWDERDPRRYEVRYEHDRVVLRVDGAAVAAIRGGGVEGSPEPVLRPRWHVYFETADVDESAALAVRLGGRLVIPPADSVYGRTAAVSDPEGGLFHLVTVRRASGRPVTRGRLREDAP